MSAALFFSFWTEAATKKEEPVPVVARAQKLFLENNRAEALSLLTSAYSRELKKNPSLSREIFQATHDIATSFLSEKSQQAFELGLSMRRSDLGVSQQKMQEAAKLEPDNLEILIELGRLALINQDCAGAQKIAERALEKISYFEEAKILLGQSAVCLGQLAQARELRQKADRKSAYEAPWTLLEVEIFFRSGQFKQGLELAKLALQKNPPNPELAYWIFRIQKELNESTEAAATQYVSMCKSLSTRAWRELRSDPFLCRRTADVESELKKPNPGGKG